MVRGLGGDLNLGWGSQVVPGLIQNDQTTEILH